MNVAARRVRPRGRRDHPGVRRRRWAVILPRGRGAPGGGRGGGGGAAGGVRGGGAAGWRRPPREVGEGPHHRVQGRDRPRHRRRPGERGGAPRVPLRPVPGRGGARGGVGRERRGRGRAALLRRPARRHDQLRPRRPALRGERRGRRRGAGSPPARPTIRCGTSSSPPRAAAARSSATSGSAHSARTELEGVAPRHRASPTTSTRTTTSRSRLFGAFIRRARAVRRFGSAALDLAYVAAGRFDGFWELPAEALGRRARDPHRARGGRARHRLRRRRPDARDGRHRRRDAGAPRARCSTSSRRSGATSRASAGGAGACGAPRRAAASAGGSAGGARRRRPGAPRRRRARRRSRCPRSDSGSTYSPPTRALQWRCGPVERPVEPTTPRRSPCRTFAPARTSIRSRWK